MSEFLAFAGMAGNIVCVLGVLGLVAALLAFGLVRLWNAFFSEEGGDK